MSNTGLSEPGVIGVDTAGDMTPGGAVAKHRGTRPAPAPPGPAGGTWTRASNVVLPIIGFIVVIAMWWSATIVFDIRSFFLPKPPEVIDEFLKLPQYLLEQTWVTVVDAMLGFGCAIALGLLISVAISSSTILYRAVMPLLVGVNSVPKVALAPLLLLWLGFEQLPRVVMTLMISFFPIVVAATAGLMNTPSDLNELGRSLSASRWQQFIKVRFRWALPQIFIGLKVGLTLAFVGAVVAELSGTGKGLGYVILASGQSANTALAFAAIGLLAIVSIGLFYLLVALERLLLPWAKEITV